MNIENGKIIANNIRAERNRANLTQEKTANNLGISLKTYITYEENAKNIKATTLCELSKLFDCEISAFYVANKST